MSAPTSLYRQSLVYALGRLAPAMSLLLSTALFTRLAPPGQYAVLVLVLAGAQIGGAALFQWLRLGLLRYGAAAGASVGGLHLRLSLGALAGAGALSLLAPAVGAEGGLILAIGVMLVAQSWFELAQELHRAEMAPARHGLVAALRGGLVLGLGGLALALTGDGYALAGAVALANVLAITPHAKRLAGSLAGPSDPALRGRLLAYGAPLGIALTLGAAGMLADRLLLALLLGPEAAGLYGPAAEIGRQAVLLPLQAVTLAAFPLAIRAMEAGGRPAANRQMAANLTLLVWVGLPATAGLALLGADLSMLLLGAPYRETGALLLPVIALGALLSGLRMFYVSQAGQLGEDTRGQIRVAGIGAIAAIALNLALIPPLGPMGAAYALCLSQAIALTAAIPVARAAFPLPFPARALLPAALATAGMALALLALGSLWPEPGPLRGLVLSALGALVYAALSVLLDTGPARAAWRAMKGAAR